MQVRCPMSGQEQHILEDIFLHGAELWITLAADHERGEVVRNMLEYKLLETLETDLGLATVLGSKGRSHFNLSPYLPDPDAALSDIFMRRICKRLSHDGWTFVDYPNRNQPFVRLKNADETLLVYCKYPDVSTVTVRRFLEETLPHYPDARLQVVVQDTKPFRGLRHPQLAVAKIDLPNLQWPHYHQ
jgi:hypothetical protein